MEGLLDTVFSAYKIDREKVKDMFWTAVVGKKVPTFSEDSGEYYQWRVQLINDHTESKVLAGYIVDQEWQFFFTLEHHAETGLFTNSPTPSFDSYLRPTEKELRPVSNNKALEDSV